MAARRFPPSWSVDDIDAVFVVNDSNGQTTTLLTRDGDSRRTSQASDSAPMDDFNMSHMPNNSARNSILRLDIAFVAISKSFPALGGAIQRVLVF